MDIQYTTVEGILNWARLDPTNPNFNKFRNADEWSVDVIVPKSTAERWVQKGLKQKTTQDKDGNFVLKFRRPALSSKGKEMKPPEVVHEEGYKIDPTTIGNGSKGKVRVALIPYSNSFGSGTTIYLTSVTITDLIEYSPDPSSIDDVEI